MRLVMKWNRKTYPATMACSGASLSSGLFAAKSRAKWSNLRSTVYIRIELNPLCEAHKARQEIRITNQTGTQIQYERVPSRRYFNGIRTV
ncbi:hypothetical protein PILCRDRAFT_600354 [Piloderma croceum F 1598]|uniref:Uncharacterized protein n=1 Tax=Piloderma croceum (strain F 1598) TaxID=765440 RepID=A0A0C3BLN2_PILCF|nr:hypothetical protein PILCRDRAFT_600354 [Piloderma croceum F 1598]